MKNQYLDQALYRCLFRMGLRVFSDLFNLSSSDPF